MQVCTKPSGILQRLIKSQKCKCISRELNIYCKIVKKEWRRHVKCKTESKIMRYFRNLISTVPHNDPIMITNLLPVKEYNLNSFIMLDSA